MLAQIISLKGLLCDYWGVVVGGRERFYHHHGRELTMIERIPEPKCDSPMVVYGQCCVVSFEEESIHAMGGTGKWAYR